MATFGTENAPQYLSIPGEQAKTKLFEYIPNPKRCNKCQSCQHPEKCKRLVPVCGKCVSKGHRIETCSSATIKCYPCGEAHYVGHRNCEKHAEEKAMLTIQTRERLTRREAIQYFNRIDPNRHRTYVRTARTAESTITTERKAMSQTNGDQPNSDDAKSEELVKEKLLTTTVAKEN